jgi:hypothetical protein
MQRFILSLLVLFLIFPICTPQEKQPPEEDLLEKTERIYQLLKLLKSKDKETQEIAYTELKKYGEQILPFVETIIKESQIGIYYRLAMDLYQQRLARFYEQVTWVDDREIYEIKGQKRPSPSTVKSIQNKYVALKLQEAKQKYREEKFKEAKTIALSLLKLEPETKYRKILTKILRASEQRITFKTLLRCTVEPVKRAFSMDEPAEFVLRIKNLLDEKVVIHPVARKTGTIILNYKMTLLDPLGTRTSKIGGDIANIHRVIELPPKAKWEMRISIDVSKDYPSVDFIRRHKVNARLLISKIEAPVFDIPRKLIFKPCQFYVVPKKYKHFLEDPLKWLAISIDKGTVNEVFINSVLLPEKYKDAGIELLMQALKKVNRTGKIVVCHCLHEITGKRFGADEKKWLKWWESQNR